MHDDRGTSGADLKDLTMERLTLAEIRRTFEAYANEYPPILCLKQASALAGPKPSTLKRKCSEGAFRKSVKRGKPLLFWRDRFVQDLPFGSPKG